MNPVLKVSLTAAGIIAAGLPLLWLTAPLLREVQPTVQKPQETLQTTYATLRFSGTPQRITIRYQGKTLAEITSPEFSPQELLLQLPEENTIELEAEVCWPDGTSGAQAFTITLEPTGRETRSETCWAEGEMHDIFVFTW